MTRILIIIIITAIVAFSTGIAIYTSLNSSSAPTSIAEHWKLVEDYKAYVLDSTNYRPDPQTGFSVTTPPTDPMPSLAALVAAGELEDVDLVLPKVPNNRETNSYWMQWAEKHKDVLFATGNAQYVDYKPSGDQPLHLQLWFRESAKPDVQQLIKDLEGLATERESVMR